MTFFPKPQPIAIAGSALGFYLLCQANEWLFESWTYGHGVNWVYLPSGLRLALVLMLGGAGALGVMIGSLLAGLDLPLSLEVTAAAAVLSGLAPWLARWICLKALRVGSDLAGLKATDVLTMSLVFALTSALLHQVLYVGTGLSDSLLKGTAVMALGDLLGTLLVLYGLKACLQFIEHKRPIDRT